MKIVKLFVHIFLVITVATLVYYFYPEQKLPKQLKINKLIVYKSKRVMLAYYGDKLLKRYRIALGRRPVGAKEYEHDFKTPEGSYFITAKSQESGY